MKAPRLFGCPPGRKSGPGSGVIVIPVKLLSNSSGLTFTFPLAGSLMNAYPFLKPFSTTKWLKFQWMMHGYRPLCRKESGVRLSAVTLNP